MTQPIMIAYKSVINGPTSGACPGFLKGGGSTIFWFPKKKASVLKGGSNGLIGGPVHLSP